MKSLSWLCCGVLCSATVDEGKQEICIISSVSQEKCNTIHSYFLRSLSSFCCWRVRHYGSHSLQTDQPRCSTLQGRSLRCYLRHLTSYRSLWYSTNKKLFQWHLVCHTFLSISFAFHGCSRSVEVLKLLLRSKTNQKNLENPSECLMKSKN